MHRDVIYRWPASPHRPCLGLTHIDEKIVCFFRPASKSKDRYPTLGFNDAAQLDDGAMWPTSHALTKLIAAEGKRIRELVKKAAGQGT